MQTWKKALVATVGSALLASTTAAAPASYVKLRPAVEGFGGQVAWDQATKTVKMTINGVDAEVAIGKSEFKLGGEKRKLPGAVELRDDWRTYVPSELVDVLKQTPDLLKFDLKAGLSSRPLIAEGDMLTDGNKFGGNPDLNVYVPINGSDEGWLATNHETRPGGMSALRIKRNAEGFYDIVESKAIDFSQVGGTWNNCAGTGTMSVFVQGGPELDLHQPDNIQIDPQGNIWVHEDKYEVFMAPAIGQSKNKLFKFTRDGKGEVIAQMPLGAEVTGGFFTPDGSVMFVNVQHPSKPNKSTVMQINLR